MYPAGDVDMRLSSVGLSPTVLDRYGLSSASILIRKKSGPSPDLERAGAKRDGSDQNFYSIRSVLRQKSVLSSEKWAINEMGLESLHLDLTDNFSMQNAVKEILKRTNGTLYALFNNGAYAQPGAIEDLSTEALRQQFETNVFGWHELTNLVLPVMIKQGYGRIIQDSSILGFISLK